MTVLSVAATALQVVGLIAAAPFVVGAMRQVRARLEGRAGAGIGQPWRDLRKLLRKQDITPAGTTVVFGLAPALVAATTLLIAAIAPLLSTGSPLDSSGDLIAVVGLLFLGTVALTLAGLDTGTAFGGMGASREITIAALVEPTILLAVFALSIPAGSANLAAIVSSTDHHPSQVASPAGVLAFVALAIVIIAEAGRLPVDNPSTHLELTMVHEAMVLEYSGRHLAMIEWAASLKLLLYISMVACIFLPFGLITGAGGLFALALSLAAYLLKVTAAALLLATLETAIAKMRVFRVPNLLGIALMLGLLGTLLLFISESL